MNATRRCPVELVYDSVRMQANFGRRCPPGEDRSLLFRAGDLSLDVLLYGGEALRGIHGQIVDEAHGVPVAGAAVSLGGHTTETDAHGQFSLPDADETRLRVRLRTGTLTFPLPTVANLAMAV